MHKALWQKPAIYCCLLSWKASKGGESSAPLGVFQPGLAAAVFRKPSATSTRPHCCPSSGSCPAQQAIPHPPSAEACWNNWECLLPTQPQDWSWPPAAIWQLVPALPLTSHEDHPGVGLKRWRWNPARCKSRSLPTLFYVTDVVAVSYLEIKIRNSDFTTVLSTLKPTGLMITDCFSETH